MSIEAPPDGPLRERATMRDVAALAGVGLKTVSRVVNGVPTVAPELAERVRTAMDKLGYRPNLTATSLRRSDGRTQTIGLLVEDVGNPFSAALFRAVEDVARERRVLVLSGSLDEDPDRERELARTLIDRRVDGLIIAPAGSDHRYVLAEQQAGTTFVFVDRLPSPLLADAVVTDNRPAAMRAVQHLLDVGHRRIGYLGDRLAIQTARDRLAGYVDAMTAAGLAVDDTLVRNELRSAAEAQAAAIESLRSPEPPQAFFASQNLVTIGAVRALHELGVARDVALVGFDDVSLGDLVVPGITVMAQDPTAIGRLAATRLFARLDDDRSPVAVHTVPSTLIVRGSGEIPPRR